MLYTKEENNKIAQAGPLCSHTLFPHGMTCSLNGLQDKGKQNMNYTHETEETTVVY